MNETNRLELIETLWNVNQEGEKYIKVFARELIETLWNVNVKGKDGNVVVLMN